MMKFSWLTLVVLLVLSVPSRATSSDTSQEIRETTYCNIIHRYSVATQWNMLWLDYEARKHVGLLSWKGLLEAYPELADSHFTKVNGHNILSVEFKIFIYRVFVDLNVVLSYLAYETTASSQMEYITRIHKRYKGLKKQHFDVFGASLVEAASIVVGEKFNRAGWQACIQCMMDNIQYREEEQTPDQQSGN